MIFESVVYEFTLIAGIKHLLITVEIASILGWSGLLMILSLCFLLIIRPLIFRVQYSLVKLISALTSSPTLAAYQQVLYLKLVKDFF